MGGTRIPLPGNGADALQRGVEQGIQQYSQGIQNQIKNQLAMKALKDKWQSNLSGVAREAYGLNQMKQMLPGGENNPVYMQAKDAFDLEQNRIKESIKSSEFYRNNPWRLFDQTTKQIHAQQQAAEGKYPGGGEAYKNPEEISKAVTQYEKERYNKSTPTFLQQQYEAAQQIDETLKLIKPEQAFPYSGAAGQVELWKDRYNSQKTGKIPKKLKEFEEQSTYLHNLREQIRSYLGSSITAGMTKDLDYMVNPSNWMNHPEIAKTKYNAIVKAYENEKKVTEKAVKHGNPSAPNPIFGSPNNEEGGSTATQAIKINGTIYDVPISELDAIMFGNPGAEIVQ